MGAPKLDKKAFRPSSSPKEVGPKAEIEQLVKKIQDKLQNPSEAKKAALIISQLINNKK